MRHGPVEDRPAPAVLVQNAAAVVQEPLKGLCISGEVEAHNELVFGSCGHQRRLALVVADVQLRPLGCEEGEDVDLSVHRGVVYRSESLRIAVFHLRSELQEQVHWA